MIINNYKDKTYQNIKLDMENNDDLKISMVE